MLYSQIAIYGHEVAYRNTIATKEEGNRSKIDFKFLLCPATENERYLGTSDVCVLSDSVGVSSIHELN